MPDTVATNHVLWRAEVRREQRRYDQPDGERDHRDREELRALFDGVAGRAERPYPVEVIVRDAAGKERERVDQVVGHGLVVVRHGALQERKDDQVDDEPVAPTMPNLRNCRTPRFA